MPVVITPQIANSPAPDFRASYDDGFFGLDTHSEPSHMAPGFAQQADNAYIVGGTQDRGGRLRTRPGFRGELAQGNINGAPVYNLKAFLDSNHVTNLLYTSGTKLFKHTKGATDWSEIKTAANASMGLASASTFSDRAGIYEYLADGVGAMKRTNLTTGETATGLTKPAAAPAASLSSRQLDPFNSLTGWYADTAASTANMLVRTVTNVTGTASASAGAAINILAVAHGLQTGAKVDIAAIVGTTEANGTGRVITRIDADHFTIAVAFVHAWISGGTVTTGADGTYALCNLGLITTTTGLGGGILCVTPPDGTIDIDLVTNIDPASLTTRYIRIDDIGDIIAGQYHIVNQPVTVNGVASSPARYPNHFRFSATYVAGHLYEGAIATITAYSDNQGASPIGTAQGTFTAVATSQGLIWEAVIGFDTLDTPILAINWQIQGGPKNLPSNQQSPYIGNLSLVPYVAPVAFTLASSQVAVSAYQAFAPTKAFLGQLHLVKDISATYASGDFSLITTLVFDVAAISSYSGLRFKIGFRATASSAYVYSNEVQLSVDGKYYYVDISNLTIAQRGGVGGTPITLIDIVFLQDVAILSSPQPSSPLFGIGPFSTAGNLVPGRNSYAWRLVEVDVSGDATVLLDTVKSDGSDPSNLVLPTTRQAVGVLTMPARTNAAAAYWLLYRTGGGINDGFYRLVGMFAFAVSTFAYGGDTNKGSGAPAYAAVANPYIAWTQPGGGTGAAGGILYDNTPDKFIFDAELYQVGRNAPPAAAQAICCQGNRVAVAVGSMVYFSWLLSNGLNNGLYFTYANVSRLIDPSAAIKGFTVAVNPKDNDPVQNIVYFEKRWYIFKSRSKWVVTASEPDDVRCDQITTEDGLGLIAPRAICIFLGAIWYLSADGLRVYDGMSQDVPASLAIEGLLNPAIRGSGAAMAPAAYALCWLMVAGRRLYLGAPAATTDTYPTCVYVFDSRHGDLATMAGWTRWTNVAFTSACALTGTNDSGEAYFAGHDGQIYVLKFDGAAASQGDKLYPAAPTTTVTMTFRSRAYCMDVPSGSDNPGVVIKGWSMHEPQSCRVFIVASESTVVTTTVTGDVSGAAESATYTYPVGNSWTWQRLNKGAQGHSVDLTISASVTLPFDIRSIELETVETENR